MKKRLMKNGQTHTVIVWVLVLLITTLLYVTQTDCEVEFFPHLDIIVFELLLIPIVLACLWKGVVAGLATSLGVSLLLLPYLIMHWEGLSAADLNRVLRILVYYLASFILGRVVMAQRRDQQRAREAENLAAIGKSMAIVAHDMKTPLISIGGFSSFVLTKLDEDFPHRDKLEIVVEETRRLENMVRNMLDYSKPLELNLAREDVAKLVKETIVLTRAIASKRGVTLLCELSDNLQPVFVDGMKLKQVLVNLVTNAIEASPEGETVTVKAFLRRKNLHIEVMDCGCGISLDQRQGVFLPFFTTKTEGTGLGLDIAKKIVESHGGRIEIVDNAVKGLIFNAVIPESRK